MSGLTDEYRHIPVLKAECLEGLRIAQGSIFVDATLGGAGHSVCAAQLLGANGTLIGIDQDDAALTAASKRLSCLTKKSATGDGDFLSEDGGVLSEDGGFLSEGGALPRDGGVLPEDMPDVELLRGNFGDLDDLLMSACVPGIDAILFDIGVSSAQIDTPERGFSFKTSSPLDMRMSPDTQTISAKDVVNTYTEQQLSRIFLEYGEEKWASRIAAFICKAREHKTIEYSDELVEIIKAAIPASARRRGGHPAKRVFQALRIEVNGELDALKSGLNAAVRWLNSGGRMAVISYHSLEDRIVKNIFNSYANRCTCPPELPVCVCGKKPILKLITKKPILPTDVEIKNNPRARSAKLRVAEKI